MRVAPTAMATLGGAINRHETRFGTVSLSWHYKEGHLMMALRVPIGSIAEVHSPLVVRGRKLLSVDEGTSKLWAVAPAETLELAATDVHSIETEDSAIVATVGSGVWSFEATYD